MRLGFNSSLREKWWLSLIVVTGLINGLLHTFLVPPWQHYDEPGHFEYTWLIANKDGLPNSGEYDQAMRREIAASMIEYDFFAGMGFRPSLLSTTEPVWIGISQTDDVPFYYILVSIPLHIFKYTDITFQLYLGRLLSLGLFLLTIFVAYGITSELTKPGNILRLLVPATVALIPGFVDIMTAVNNDVGAVVLFTLFLWVGVRILQRGITWKNSILLILLAFICIFTKGTTISVFPLVIIAITISLLPQTKRIYAWLTFSLIGLVLLTIFMPFNAVAFWHMPTQENHNRRLKTNTAPLGEYVLEIDNPPDTTPSSIVHVVPIIQSKYLKGKSVTVGAWIWASSPIQTLAPVLDDGTTTYIETIYVETNPEYYTYKSTVDDHANKLLVRLQSQRQYSDVNISIFFDGITLVEGDHTQVGHPSFLDVNGGQVEWGSERLTNYIRNGSFEISAPQLRPQIDTILASYLRSRLSLVTASLIDFEGYQAYYTATSQHLFRSFWAVFGWGQVLLVGSKPYRILLIISFIALIGDGIYIWRNWRLLPLHILGFLGLALLGVWGVAATRGVDSVFSNLYIPASRYAYPAIVPTVLLFVVGWCEVLNKTGEKLKIPRVYQFAAYILFLVILNVISIYSIWLYYDSV